MPQDIKKLEKIAQELRQTVIDMLLEAESGHTGGSLGTADIFTALYFHILNINPKSPNAKNRDRFVLSNGHICPIWYAALSKKGFFPKSKLWTLRKLNSDLQGHPKYQSVPGIENVSGSLGQGLSQAVGMAMAAKMDKASYRTYVMTGDGELNEGQVWEAAMFCPSKGLNNITWIIDRNSIQSDGNTQDIMPIENLKAKLESFNWFVIEVDGHNIEEIINACNMAKSVNQRPTVIIAHTILGKGVKFMENDYVWHGRTPSPREATRALKELKSL